MKLTLDGTPEEFLSKGPELLKSLARRLGVDPLALVHPDDLEKAKPSQPTLRYKALKQIHERERKIVQDTYDAMVKDIQKILEG